MQRSVQLYPWMAESTTGWTISTNLSWMYYGLLYTGTGATSAGTHELPFVADMLAGDYRIKITGQVFGANGKAHVIVGGVDKGSIDFYGSIDNNQTLSLDFTLASDETDIVIRNDSKNVSSVGYRLAISHIELAIVG